MHRSRDNLFRWRA